MIDFEDRKKVEFSIENEQIKIFAIEETLFVTIVDHSYGSGYCVIHNRFGEIVTSQELTKGTNIINHTFQKGQYYFTLSLGSLMFSNILEIN